jgi:tRNA(adenine34) deaminase
MYAVRYAGALCHVCGCIALGAGALHWVQLQKLVFGASDIQRGYSLVQDPLLHPKTQVVKGIKGEEAKSLIDEFFKRLRK